jgi:hypothetical protein
LDFFSSRLRIEVAEALRLAPINMINATVGTMVRVRKGSRGYTYEEIPIRILCWNILSVFNRRGRGSLLGVPYRSLLRRK